VARHPSLERRIGHRFNDPALLARALTHRSFGSPHNERLEFLGDGVLGCVIADELYARFPDIPEGKLHLLKVSLVRETTLVAVAQDIDLASFLQLGAAEVSNSGSAKPSILSDTLEAVYGAVFLDGGYGAAQNAIRTTFKSLLNDIDLERSMKDAKTRLNEYAQKKRWSMPAYRIVAASADSQNPSFDVECAIADKELAARGTGTSRQRAEQQAAENLLRQIGG
jgi:ribonuclease-3